MDRGEKLRRRKDAMTGCPSTYVMTVSARHHRAALYAEADRERLVRLIQPGPKRRSRWPDVSTRAGIVLALVLPFLAALWN
jgi:hypothetical protein